MTDMGDQEIHYISGRLLDNPLVLSTGEPDWPFEKLDPGCKSTVGTTTNRNHPYISEWTKMFAYFRGLFSESTTRIVTRLAQTPDPS